MDRWQNNRSPFDQNGTIIMGRPPIAKQSVHNPKYEGRRISKSSRLKARNMYCSVKEISIQRLNARKKSVPKNEAVENKIKVIKSNESEPSNKMMKKVTERPRHNSVMYQQMRPMHSANLLVPDWPPISR